MIFKKQNGLLSLVHRGKGGGFLDWFEGRGKMGENGRRGIIIN